VTHHEVRPPDLRRQRIPIGRPVVNATLYVLTPDDGGGWRAATEGEPGELFVGGVPVGAGYPDDPEATRAAFFGEVLDPRSPTGRLYRTGDAAAVQDGVVHYLGRLDRQVKVSGVRIELGEIEAVIARHPAVRRCAVGVETNGGYPDLAAYCVTVDGSLPAEELRELAGRRLPAAMIPTRWYVLDELPLSASGKIDHRALAAGPDPTTTLAEPGTGRARTER
jgi:acyl-coenzyme A synthetase/AMP-(fatty) acid ligase